MRAVFSSSHVVSAGAGAAGVSPFGAGADFAAVAIRPGDKPE
jgi:hypothetical protein